MELKFEDEQEGENTQNHMKIPNSDQIFKEQVKLEQLESLKGAIKTNKIFLIFVVIVFSI